MKYKVEISYNAETDLRNIYRYIAFELSSPQNANSLLDSLKEAILALDEMPKRYRVFENEPWKTRGLRLMPVGNYLVFYTSDDEKGIVTVNRVMYGGRNIDEELKNS